jgi:hypothetical protein
LSQTHCANPLNVAAVQKVERQRGRMREGKAVSAYERGQVPKEDDSKTLVNSPSYSLGLYNFYDEAKCRLYIKDNGIFNQMLFLSWCDFFITISVLKLTCDFILLSIKFTSWQRKVIA